MNCDKPGDLETFHSFPFFPSFSHSRSFFTLPDQLSYPTRNVFAVMLHMHRLVASPALQQLKGFDAHVTRKRKSCSRHSSRVVSAQVFRWPKTWETLAKCFRLIIKVTVKCFS